MDINPVHDGHCLVIPKAHYPNVFEIAPEAMAAVARTAARVAKAVEAAVKPDGLNLIQANGRRRRPVGRAFPFPHLPAPARRRRGDQLGAETRRHDPHRRTGRTHPRAAVARQVSTGAASSMTQLHRVAAAIGVAPEMAGDMDRAAARARRETAPSGVSATRKAIAGRRAGPTGSARVQRRWPLPTGSACATRTPGKGEARLGIGGAERRQRVEMIDQSGDRAGGATARRRSPVPAPAPRARRRRRAARRESRATRRAARRRP